jgi:hypothetical protein
METDQLKPDLIAVDFSIYGHEVTKQSHVDTAVERRGTLSFHERILRYAHIFRVLVKAHFLHQYGLPEAALNDYFDQDELECLDAKGDLISESFSLWLKSQKEKDCDLAPFFGRF